MGRKKGNDGWEKLGLALLALAIGGLVYHAQTGRGEENDAALIPNDLEHDIDRVVAALNKQFGHQWVDWGIEVLRSYLRRTLPHVAALVDVVSAVELQSRRWPMTSQAKKQAAVQMALAG
jgi:hypothetical protein